MDSESSEKEPSPEPLPTGWLARRKLLSDMLAIFLTKEAYEEAKTKNWAILTTILVVIGAISDLTTIFGPIVEIGLVTCLVLLIIFAGLCKYSKERRKVLAYPLLATLIGAIVFFLCFTSQKIFAAGDSGVIAKVFPLASKIQVSIYENIMKIQVSVDSTRDSVKNIESKQDLMKDKLDDLSEMLKTEEGTLLTVISPHSGNQVTGIIEKKIRPKCFLLYDLYDHYPPEYQVFRAANHTLVVKLYESYLNNEEGSLNKIELSEYHCILGFRLEHLNTVKALEHYKISLLSNPDNIGSLLGMYRVTSDPEFITRAYEVAERNEKISAFPYIILSDISIKHINFDFKKRNNLIRIGLKMSEQFEWNNMADRFFEGRLLFSINEIDLDKAKLLLKHQYSNCDQRPTYIDEIRCHKIRSLLFHHVRKWKEESVEIKKALSIAEKNHDRRAVLYLNNEILRKAAKGVNWRERESKLLDILDEAEKFEYWDILQMTWANLAHIASFSRQNPKLALERMTKAVGYMDHLNTDSML